jgi:adenosine deaminase CECR1
MKARKGYWWAFLIAASTTWPYCSSNGAAQATNKIETEPDYLRSLEAYDKKRDEVLQTLQQEHFCANVPFNKTEENADGLLSQLRSNEVAFYKSNGRFPPSRLFFEAKADIEASKLFPIFKRMPKGGLLHTHEASAGRAEFIVTNITCRPDCYIQWIGTNDSQHGYLAFLTNGQPASSLTTNGFYLANTLREQLATNGISLDHELRRLLMIEGGDQRSTDIWGVFGQCFMRTIVILRYRPAWRDYLRDAFKTLIDDGIRHVEIRVMAPVPIMFDHTSRTYCERDTLREYLDARDFVRTNCGADFTLKMIMTGYRDTQQSDAPTIIKKTQEYQRMFPDLVIGCDWVGEEDGGQTTREEVPYLLEIARDPDSPIHFYFHDGETAWPGNHNLIDAVLLRTKRVGHGFDLFQFPSLERMIIKNGIVVEVCPISNQLLRLMHDLRLHPAIGYMNRGVECVLGSDDPAILGNDGLTYDFWEAYVGWGIHLRAIKRLAENSLFHAALSPKERYAALAAWRQQWDAWIGWVVRNYP